MVKQNSTKSFTLIEMLIVASIIVVLSGSSLAILSIYRDDKVLSSHVSILAHTFELAKNKANAGDVALCSDNQIAHIDGYTVVATPSAITILPGCDTEPTVINYPIPSNVIYITPTFSLRFGGQNYQGETRKFPMKNVDTGKCKFVQIDEVGLITNGDMACP